ncbi:MAG: hypothetical protein K2N64_00500 [Anaeroplasmataceae bacterium]|nr:hypothetical protein [Anaeroplasmataceae bacterium]
MIDLSKAQQLKEEIDKITKITKRISFLRFCIFVCIVIFVVCFITLDQFILYLSLSLLSIFCFIACVIFTSPLYHKLKLLTNLSFVYKKHENRRNLSYHSFTPDGRELIDYKDYKELDLDLLGPRSLYQYLCVAKSKEGRSKLAKQLSFPEQKSEQFTACVASLSKDEAVLRLEASISLIGADAKDCDEKEMLGITKTKIKIPWYGFLLCALSYGILAVFLTILLIHHIDPYFLFLFIPINFLIAKRCIQSEVFVFPSTKYANLLSAYKRLAKDVLEIELDDPYYKNLQKTIEAQYNSLVKLSRIFEMLSYRKNIILSIVGNGLFYLDYILAGFFNSFTKHLDSIEECLDALSELELLLSLATIGIDQETYCIPQKTGGFTIVDGYHPLVKSCVANSFHFSGGIILTGSNMSGKTTFMRMLGVNQILANAGGIVCAKEFCTGTYQVVTSLRANDMLQEGISTFYAEVHRMKQIMECSHSRDTLVLVDEIFKGTNAKDRIYAAKEIIHKLSKMGVYFLITTHDFELCDVEEIKNYHFDEEYVGDQITFDYKIKDGKCQKTNAIYLLKLAGVLDTKE